MDTGSNRSQWRERVEAFERSGSSRRAWCMAHGVKVGTLDYWRHRLRTATKMERHVVSPSLVPIVVRSGESEVTAATMVVLVLPSGVRMSVPVGIGATWLASLLREIGAC